MTIIAFTTVKKPYGWMGNMSPYPVTYEGKEYRTAEALFQCLRFINYPEVQRQIRMNPSPMEAKRIAKYHQRRYRNHVLSPSQDVDNMLLCLRLKLECNPKLRALLKATDDALIIEDCTNRQGGSGQFWGAALINDEWIGENILGELWMVLRDEPFEESIPDFIF